MVETCENSNKQLILRQNDSKNVVPIRLVKTLFPNKTNTFNFLF